MLREALCRAETGADSLPEDVKKLVGNLIGVIDTHRPLGRNGEHGNLHTPRCGCETKKTQAVRFFGTYESASRIIEWIENDGEGYTAPMPVSSLSQLVNHSVPTVKVTRGPDGLKAYPGDWVVLTFDDETVSVSVKTNEEFFDDV